MNKKLTNIAEDIRKKSNIPPDENFGSIIAVLMIISIILTLVRVLQECNKNKLQQNYSQEEKTNLYGSEIRSYSLKRGWFTKMRIKKIMRNQMSKEQYSKYSLSLLNAILTQGETVTDDDVITLMEAANV